MPPLRLSKPPTPLRPSRTILYAHVPSPPPDLRAANHLINMHAKRGDLQLAHQLFAQMPHKNIVSWTILISAYAQHGRSDPSFRLFSQMLSHHIPNDFTYASLLSVCDYSHGTQLHGLALRTGFHAWVYVANALLAMYWKNSNSNSNSNVNAWMLFDDMDFRNLVTYNSMIAGLAMHQQGDRAMTLFIKMCRDGIEFDRTTLLTLISSFCGHGEEIVQVHSLATKTGLALDTAVATALIKAYSILGHEISACHKLFLDTHGMHRDLVLWTAIMTASAERDPEQALGLYNQLRGEEDYRVCPDGYVFSVLLKACASLMRERNASAVHCQVITTGFVNVVELDNALIHAYARCGSMDKAEQVFHEMSWRDIVSWNSILKAYAVHGMAERVFDLFKQRMDVAPDETTFVALLSCCSHAGMVKEGSEIFESMEEKYGIVPQLDHYACMVDILGRAGHLWEAQELIRKMPMQPDYVVWSALLGACRKHGETRLANLASSKLKELDPENSVGYVLISNIYCWAGSYDAGGLMRKKMDRVGVRKEPGLSWTEVGS